MQEFNLDRKYTLLLKVCLIVFLAFTALGLALPFLPDDGHGSLHRTLWVSFFCTLVPGSFAVLSWLTLRKLPYMDVVADEEGVRYRHEPRETGLIPWDRIAGLRERRYSQCLDVLDAHGRKLMRVEYQLEGFETLRRLLVDRIRRNNGHTRLPGRFSKGSAHHLFQAACIAGFSALGWYVGANESVLLGYIAMPVLVLAVVYEYLTTAYRVTIEGDRVHIAYPLSLRSIRASDIASLEVADVFQRGTRYPVVRVRTKDSRKPFRLQGLGADAHVLFAALQAARDRSR